MLVSQHDGRIADLDLGMPYLAAGVREAHQLGGTERLLVKANGAGCVLDNQVGRGGVIAVGDWFNCHRGLLLFIA